MIRNPWFAISGSVVASVLYAVAVGYFVSRAEAVARGLIINPMGNQVKQVTTPESPALQFLAIACLAGLLVTAYVAAIVRGLSALIISSASGLAAAVLLGLGAWALLTTGFPHTGPFDSTELPIVAWLREAGLSPATHAVAATLAMLALFTLLGSRRIAPDPPAGLDK